MTLTLQYKGFNYVDYYNGDYTENNSLSELAATGTNSIALTPDFGINVSTSGIVAGAATTDANATTLTTGDLGTVMSDADALGVTTFLLRPLVDILYPQESVHNPGNYYVPNGFQNMFDPGDTGATTIAYNPSGNTADDTVYNDNVPNGITPATVPIGTSDNNLVDYRGDVYFNDTYNSDNGITGDLNAATFFGSPTTPGSYDYMIVNEATAQEAALPNGATGIFSIGTELDGLATDQTPAVIQDWDNLIQDVRTAAPDLKLTYSANWATAGDVTFWNKLDYVGIDGYVPLSNDIPDSAADNPTVATLEAGWNEPSSVVIAYSDGTTVSQQLQNEGLGGGNGSAIDSFDQLAQESEDKQFIFTEIGYENDTGAANDPTGGSPTGVADPSLQADLYTAFFDAWGQAQQTANGDGGDVDGAPFALAGAFIWTWNPNLSQSPTVYDDWSPYDYPANTVITTGFSASPPPPPITLSSSELTNEAGVGGPEGEPTAADGNVLTNATDSNSGATMSISAVNGSAADVGKFFDTTYGEIELQSDGQYRYFPENSTTLQDAPTGTPPVDTIDFTVEDTDGATINATLSISVYRNPTAVNETGTVGAGGTLSATGGTSGTGALDGDSDPDGAGLTASVINALGEPDANPIAGSYGTLTFNSDGSYSYTADSETALASDFAANDGEPLPDGFDLIVGAAGSVSAFTISTLTIDVTPAASPPPPPASPPPPTSPPPASPPPASPPPPPASPPPVIGAPSTATVTSGQATAISGVSLSQSGATGSETFTVELTDANGALSATGVGVTGGGTTDLLIAGSLSNVNAALATLTDTESSASPDTITISASDSLGDTATSEQIAVAVSSPTLQNEINALYEQVLDRPADPGGLATYTALLENGTSLATIRTGLAQSQEAQNDLNALYEQVLNRPGDPGGLATYTQLLGTTTSLAGIEQDLAQSGEAQNDLNMLYEQVLGRAGDPGGLATYTALLGSGTSLDAIRLLLAQSQEAQNDINAAYEQVLDRAADPGGLAAYTQFLGTTGSLSQVVPMLAQSGEAQSDLNNLYEQVLDRAGDPGGLANYTALLASGTSLNAIQMLLAQSPEAQSDLNALYEQVLDRAGDPGGLANYATVLGTPGESLSGIEQMLAQSPEAQTDVSTLFQGIIGRSPDAAELVGMEDQLGTGITQAELQAALTSTGSAGGYTTQTAPTGNGSLTAQAGTPTLFAFDNVNFGNVTIAGFDPTRDTVEVASSQAANFTALQGDMSSVAAGTLITFNANQTILLSGVAPTGLGAANFLIG